MSYLCRLTNRWPIYMTYNIFAIPNRLGNNL
jgi:hypothetical protein